MRQTTNLRKEDVDKKWFIVDAKGVTLGRLATLVATYLRGKHKPTFTPNVDMGDNIIVINAKDIKLSSNKDDKKIYYSHSGYPGGLKSITAKELIKKKPTSLVEKAIKGMLPHTKLGDKQRQNLYVYPETEHKHEAQAPEKLEVK